MNNLFLIAARKKYRFETSKGLLNVEQLFELTDQVLHELYLSLENQIQKSNGLLGRHGNTEVENKLGIVKAIFDQLQEEKEEAKARLTNKELKGKILEAIAEKEVENLKGKSIKDLRKMVEEL